MADFENKLNSLFLAAADEALAERLASAAVERIEREDARRRLVLVSGASAGVLATLSIVDLSGAVSLMREVAGEMTRSNLASAYVWQAAAGLLTLYAVASLRRSRTA